MAGSSSLLSRCLLFGPLTSHRSLLLGAGCISVNNLIAFFLLNLDNCIWRQHTWRISPNWGYSIYRCVTTPLAIQVLGWLTCQANKPQHQWCSNRLIYVAIWLLDSLKCFQSQLRNMFGMGASTINQPIMLCCVAGAGCFWTRCWSSGETQQLEGTLPVGVPLVQTIHTERGMGQIMSVECWLFHGFHQRDEWWGLKWNWNEWVNQYYWSVVSRVSYHADDLGWNQLVNKSLTSMKGWPNQPGKPGEFWADDGSWLTIKPFWWNQVTLFLCEVAVSWYFRSNSFSQTFGPKRHYHTFFIFLNPWVFKFKGPPHL